MRAVVAPEQSRAQTGPMKPKPLTLSERIVIQTGVNAGEGHAAIALRLGPTAEHVEHRTQTQRRETGLPGGSGPDGQRGQEERGAPGTLRYCRTRAPAKCDL